LYQDENNESIRYEGGTLPQSALKLTLYPAIPIETGVLIKLKWFALRYTFQYRFAIKMESKDYINPFMHSFGIGICY
jgi:hypothetical protein